MGESADAQDLLAHATTHCPDLVLLDRKLPGIQFQASLIAALRALCPLLRVIVLSGRLEGRDAALAAGADAFVSKGDPPEGILAMLRPVCVGGEK